MVYSLQYVCLTISTEIAQHIHRGLKQMKWTRKRASAAKMMPIEQSSDAERRQYPRYAYSRYILFANQNRIFQGDLKNYSLYGLYIQSREQLPVGEIITVALPFSEDKNDKRKGQIVWCNGKGFGVELFRDPSDRIMRQDIV
jgi:hypothetical protein